MSLSWLAIHNSFPTCGYTWITHTGPLTPDYQRHIQGPHHQLGWAIYLVCPSKSSSHKDPCWYWQAVQNFSVTSLSSIYICSRIAAVPSFPGLCHFHEGRGFKQWTGNDSKGLMKVCSMCRHQLWYWHKHMEGISSCHRWPHSPSHGESSRRPYRLLLSRAM